MMTFFNFSDVLTTTKITIMKKIVLVLFSLIFIFLFSACKKNHDKEIQPPKGPELPAGVTSKDVQIILPENSSVDLASCRVFSLSFQSPIDEKGNAKAAFNTGYPNIAYVFDKNKNVILAGFITDSSNTVSVASTAEVLLYFGMGTTFQPYEIMGKFINGIGKVPGVAEWKTQVEAMFKNDPMMLQKGLFVDALKTKVATIIKTGTIPRKPADITVEASDIRSGLQLSENGFNSFIITNNIRRRSYAFLYKMNYTDLNNTKVTVNNVIKDKVTSLSITKISATGAIRDYKGVMQDWAAGKGMDFAATTNGPIEIPFEDNELEANFKVRVIGPGKPVLAPMTSFERERWWNVSLQTALFDYLLPAVLDAIGHKEILDKMNSRLSVGNNLENLEALVKKTSDLIAAIPAATDALETGDYGKVATEVFFAITNSRAGNAASEWLKFLYNNVADYVEKNASEYYKDPSVLDDRLENLVSILEVIDMGMKGVDYARITKAILQSNTIEEWDLKAKEVQLNLTPKEFSIGPLDQKKITAFIKTTLGDNVVVEYEWTTTGKYGYLWDDRGHKGTSFSSSLKEAYYLCNAAGSALSGGKHSDTIKVTAYLKSGQTRTKIASGTSVANVGKDIFYLGWTRNNGISLLTDGTYNAGPPSFSAQFDAKENAKGYTIVMIGKGGNELDPRTIFPYYGPLIRTENGKVKIGLVIGRLSYITGMNEEQMEKAKADREKMLDEYPGNGFKVTVNY